MSSRMFVSSDFAVGEDEHHVHQFLAGAGLEQAVQAVRQPADGECLAAAGGMVDEILAADVALGGELRRDVVRDLPHQCGSGGNGETG